MSDRDAWQPGVSVSQRTRVFVARSSPALFSILLIAAEVGVSGWNWMWLPLAGLIATGLLLIAHVIAGVVVASIAGSDVWPVRWPPSLELSAALLVMCGCVAFGNYLGEQKVERMAGCIADLAPYADSEQVERVMTYCKKTLK